MVTYTAFGVNGNGGHGSASSFTNTGGVLTGTFFTVTASGYQLSGYGLWCCDAVQAASTSVSFALYTAVASGAGTLVSNSAATLGTQTAGTWAYVSLGTPLALTVNTVYKAVVGANDSLPITSDTGYFGTAGTGVNGITNGPLTVFSDISTNGGTHGVSFNDFQCTFDNSGTGFNPASIYPVSNFSSFNAWIDVQITPAGTNSSPEYAASYDIIAGGSGSWVNPANAEGAPDSSYATWTAP